MDDTTNLTIDKLSEINDSITKVTDQLFSNNIQSMFNEVISIIEKVQQISGGFDNEGRLLINQIIQYASIALENKDYLLVSDILTYEMMPIINRLSKQEGMYDNI